MSVEIEILETTSTCIRFLNCWSPSRGQFFNEWELLTPEEKKQKIRSANRGQSLSRHGGLRRSRVTGRNC